MNLEFERYVPNMAHNGEKWRENAGKLGEMAVPRQAHSTRQKLFQLIDQLLSP
jgi:hypothetical protein